MAEHALLALPTPISADMCPMGTMGNKTVYTIVVVILVAAAMGAGFVAGSNKSPQPTSRASQSVSLEILKQHEETQYSAGFDEGQDYGYDEGYAVGKRDGKASWQRRYRNELKPKMERQTRKAVKAAYRLGYADAMNEVNNSDRINGAMHGALCEMGLEDCTYLIP